MRLAKISARVSSLVSSVTASTSGSLRVATFSAVVSGRSCTRTPRGQLVPAGFVLRSGSAWVQYSSRSLIRVAVHMRPEGVVARGLPVECCLHALRSGNLDPGARQVDGMHGEDGFSPEGRVYENSSSQGSPSMACVTSVLSEKRTSINPVSAAIDGSAPSMRPSARMVSIRSRLLA